MKNVLLLGNGFDVYNKFPTKYQNFLLTINFLKENKEDTIATMADVWGNPKLYDKDKHIKECYFRHQKIYDEFKIDNDKVAELIKLTNNNYWFLYLSQSFNKDVGWIDFEREIGEVLNCFREFLKQTNVTFMFSAVSVSKYCKYIIKFFDFFFEKTKDTVLGGEAFYRVKKKYIIEEPLGSGNEYINVDKIIDELLTELDGLSKALKLYLLYFVEDVLDAIKKEKDYERCKVFSNIDQVISFNYTNTYEKLYLSKQVFHIHGNVNENIVLGINPDKDDEIETVDTLFVRFKKYFQRTFFETDIDYLTWIRHLDLMQENISLMVMGHSLDVTDADIIKELFRCSEEIIILYHSPYSKASLISNLVQIFGKEEFDYIRKNRGLMFLSLDSDLGKFVRKHEEEYARITQNIPNPIII